MTQQGRGQNVLNQGRLAGTADTSHTDQALKWKLNADILQVVVARTFQNEARCTGLHQSLEAHANLFAPAEVSAGQRVGPTQVLCAAIKHDLTATFARTRAHVNHAIGRQHHGRVVLHHHQRIARIAQPLHGHDDAVHVARVQTNAGLVQHEQGIDQRGAQGRGEVDALHLAPRQGPALAIQRQVADANIRQVLEAGGDLFEQELERLEIRRACPVTQACLQRIKKAPQPIQRQLHQIMQAQTRQRLKLRPRPLHPNWHEAFDGVQYGVGVKFAANAP